MTVRRTCLFAIAVALATLAAAAPASAQRLGLTFIDAEGPGELFAELDNGGGTNPVPTSIRLVVERGGGDVFDESASGAGYAFLTSDFSPKPGDVLRIYSPSTATDPNETYVHRATLEPCVSATSVTGTSAVTLPEGATVSAWLRPDGGPTEFATIALSGDTYTATWPRPIAANDDVYLDASSNRAAFSFGVSSRVIRRAVDCGSGPPPTGSPPGGAPPPGGDPPPGGGGQPPGGGDTPPGTEQAGPPPAPVTGEKVNVEVVRGKVTVRLPDGRRVPLQEAEQIPTGSVVDARKGAVRLTSTAPGGGTQSAVFSGGMFKVTQSRGKRPVTTLRLVERLAPCPKAEGARAAARRKARKRRLWGDGKGSFRTRGRRSAATVTGTKWLVLDSCAGTLTRVERGKVRVRDFGRRRTITLRAGQKYLAR